MTWAKLDDAFYDHPKVLRAGEDAADLYVRALAYCSRYLTDGAIPVEALSRLSTRRNVRASAEKLVDTKLWERDGNVYRVHDYLAWNPSAEDIRKMRESKRDAGSRGAKARWQSDGKPVAGAMAGAMAEPMAERWQSDGSRARSPTPTPTPTPKREREEEPNLVPTAPRPGTLPGEESAPKASRPKAPPLPFKPIDALTAIARHAGGRFLAGEERDLVGGVCIALTKAIRRYPTIAEWETLGAYLAAGGVTFPADLGPSWAASARGAEAMAAARAWDAGGRGAVVASQPAPRLSYQERHEAEQARLAELEWSSGTDVNKILAERARVRQIEMAALAAKRKAEGRVEY